ncbi:MAG: alginate export family protein [Alphaproteobacteria bacterium]|nr:alginate export family protein [Alphaproteobacteria bacterium]MBU1513857.1 alginate export family protein [Alphaproteobacteria bacterium]MBU2094498.1 alginate export family protein [Alphaproteobacteria bacterium]MBU2151241.1 alginate export family protein [Alphaproteobacteria bacterium]MBU2305889.1 alginate export family protein [Alphaproteobacteria bacterium]
MRVRYETVNNQVRPGFNNSDDIYSLRTTLFAEADFGAVRVGGELYDSRIWNADARSPVSTAEVNTFEPVQAYVAVDHDTQALGKVTLQAGRFMLNLGSRRLIAADDYRNTTNGYTGLRLDGAPAGLKTTLIYVMPQMRRPDDLSGVLDGKQALDKESQDAVLWGGIVARPKTIAGATLEGSYFRFDEKDAPGRPTRNRHLDTASLRVIRDPAAGAWDFEVEAIGQTGKVRAGLAPADPYRDVAAGFLHADAGYTFVHPWKPRLSAEVDIGSGDTPGGDVTRFDTLFGMRRADLAPSGIFAALQRANIVTPGLRLEVAPSPRWEGFVLGRGLWLDAAEDTFATTGVRDARGASGKYAGALYEARVRWWVVPTKLRFEANGVWLDKGRFLRRAPNAPKSGDETYLSLNLTATY